MGVVIERKDKIDIDKIFRLVIFVNPTQDQLKEAFSINQGLAQELLKYRPLQRTVKLEPCFANMLMKLPEHPIIKDIDVMFNPSYRVDVLKLLTSAYKQTPFDLIWPGSFADGKLLYSESQYPDYRFYAVKDYDIYCVI